MFSIEADFTAADLERWINEDVDAWFDELSEKYKKAGIAFVDKARARTKSEGGFGNITWNLRSSIGCLLVYNGQAIFTYFPTIKNGALGSQTGENYAREIAVLVNEGDGVQLVIVAGMEYASFLEDREDTDVISDLSKGFPKDLLKEVGL